MTAICKRVIPKDTETKISRKPNIWRQRWRRRKLGKNKKKQEAVYEPLGTRVTRRLFKQHTRTPWFLKEIKSKCRKKRQTYLNYRFCGSAEAYAEYKSNRNETKLFIKRVKNDYWESFSKRMEKDFYELQKQFWRLIRTQSRD